MRLPVPEDFEPAVRCGTCGEWLSASDAGFYDGAHFHPVCRPDLVRCCWCGEWLPKDGAKQVGEETYHQLCFQEVK
jgi:formylmethanofuran dehydrogenase subunit E